MDRMDALKTAGMVATAGGLAIGGLPNLVEAKKIINLEEARELGEKKMIDIEKAKGPLIKVMLRFPSNYDRGRQLSLS